ncbi:MAG: hypothetical protein ACLR77_13860 [Oscillospiraceae bacterium]
MKILMIILLCLCLLLQIGCMGNPDTKESHQSGAETTLTEKNMTDTERDSETTKAVSEVDNNAPISMTNGELIDFLSLSSPHWYSYFMDGDDKNSIHCFSTLHPIKWNGVSDIMKAKGKTPSPAHIPLTTKRSSTPSSVTRFGIPNYSFLSRWMFSIPTPERKRFL